jgi:endonuclease/exonuclease/phosphatase (EEP) superfamily protein YafD
MFTALACSALLCVFLKNNSNLNIILPIANKEASLSVAHINLANAENDVEAVLKELITFNVDILSLQEYTPFWEQALQEYIDLTYDYKHEMVRIDPHGIAILSTLEFVKKDTFYIQNIPGINVQVDVSDKTVDIIASYISPSLDRSSADLADNQLKTINEIIKKEKLATIVVGEFNHVYWSNKIRTFRSENQLLNSRRNVSATEFSVPVDHIFHTSDLECTLFENLIDDKNRRLGIIGKYQFGFLPEENGLKSTYGYK